MSDTKLVKPDPDRDFYVYWSYERRDCIGIGEKAQKRNELGLSFVAPEMFGLADSESSAADPDELFPFGSGYVRRADLVAWIDGWDSFGRRSPESSAFVIPGTSRAHGVESEKLYKALSDGVLIGCDHEHISEVESFYNEFILPPTSPARRDFGDERIITELGGTFLMFFQNSEWLGWASMFYHLDTFWRDYAVFDYYSRTMDVVKTIQALESFSLTVRNADWKIVYRILAAMENGGVQFSLTDSRELSGFLALVTEFGWLEIESRLALISRGFDSATMRDIVSNGIDTEIITSALS